MREPGSTPAEEYGADGTALLFAAPGEGAAAVEALTLTGVRIAGRFGTVGPEPHEGPIRVNLVMVEAAGAGDALEPMLAAAIQSARRHGATLIVTVAATQMDAAWSALDAEGWTLQCEPTLAERITALAEARARPVRLNEAARDAETARLQRLNEEVARIADTLARLSRGDEPARAGSVRDPGTGYRGPDDADTDVSAQEVRAVIRSRRLRSQYFPGDLLADPAWDMLLDLFAAALEKRQVSVSSLCIAAAVPPTTALRWIGRMSEEGLFERRADPVDRRRAYIALSRKGYDGMRAYAAAAKRLGLALT